MKFNKNTIFGFIMAFVLVSALVAVNAVVTIRDTEIDIDGVKQWKSEICVVDIGGEGDYSTWAGVQSCINTAPATGGTILVKDGVYGTVTTATNINKSDIHIKCNGECNVTMDSSITNLFTGYNTGTTANHIVLAGDASRKDEFVNVSDNSNFKDGDLVLVCDNDDVNASGTLYNHCGLNIVEGLTDSTRINLHYALDWNYLTSLGANISRYDNYLKNIKISGFNVKGASKTNNQVAFDIRRSVNGEFFDNTFEDVGDRGMTIMGINNKIYHNTVTNSRKVFGYGIVFGGNFNQIYNNHIRDCSKGIDSGSTNYWDNNNQITGNIISNVGAAGVGTCISLHDGTSNTLISNNFCNNVHRGVDTAGWYTVVDSNTFNGLNGVICSTPYSTLEGNAQYTCIVTNNKFFKMQSFGINAQSGHNYFIFTGNQFIESTVSANGAIRAQNGSNGIIAGNSFIDCTTGIEVESTANVTLGINQFDNVDDHYIITGTANTYLGDGIMHLKESDDSVHVAGTLNVSSYAGIGMDPRSTSTLALKSPTGGNEGLYIDNTNNGWYAMNIYSNMGAGASDKLIYVNVANSGFDQTLLHLTNAGTGNSIYLDHNGNGDVLTIDNAGSGDFIKCQEGATSYFNVDDEGNTHIAGYAGISALPRSTSTLVLEGPTGGNEALYINNTANSWYGMNVFTNEDSASAAPLFFIKAEHASFDQHVLSIANDGTANGINIDNNGNGNGINVQQDGQGLHYSMASTTATCGAGDYGFYMNSSGIYVCYNGDATKLNS